MNQKQKNYSIVGLVAVISIIGIAGISGDYMQGFLKFNTDRTYITPAITSVFYSIQEKGTSWPGTTLEIDKLEVSPDPYDPPKGKMDIKFELKGLYYDLNDEAKIYVQINKIGYDASYIYKFPVIVSSKNGVYSFSWDGSNNSLVTNYGSPEGKYELHVNVERTNPEAKYPYGPNIVNTKKAFNIQPFKTTIDIKTPKLIPVQ